MPIRRKLKVDKGEKYGSLLVEDITFSNSGNNLRSLRVRYLCICDCGKRVVVSRGSDLLRGRNYCSKKCPEIFKGRDPVKRREAARKSIRTRRENGSEARRIEAVKKAHQNGRYAARNKMLSEFVKVRNEQGLHKLAEEGREKAGYVWMMGENHPYHQMSEDEKQAQIRRLQDANRRTPNKFELRLAEFIRENSLPFDFTGDLSFWVRAKGTRVSRNPDFVHNDRHRKQAILAHGRYWHKDPLKVQREVDDYTKAGWAVFIVWEDDSLDGSLAGRIRAFVNLRGES